MDNELSQLDALIESDVLDALGKTPEETPIYKNENEDTDSGDILIENLIEDTTNDISNSDIETVNEIESQDNEKEAFDDDVKILATEEQPTVPIEQEINIAGLSKLLGELLNNKTIEITIKIKE